VGVEWLVVGVFAAVYLGMALGRWPGLALDRTGIALIGAISLFAVGVVDGARVVSAIDFPTLAILLSLMVVSAQVEASGLFARCGAALAASRASPRIILLLVVLVSGGLSAVLTNDVVVWALTPVLVRGLKARGLDARPYVVALACAANAGSAATVIGNPQNILIGEVGGLDFWRFLAVCGVPAGVSLVIVWGVCACVWRRSLARTGIGAPHAEATALDGGALAKAVLATAGVVAVFTLPVARAAWVLAIAALLLLSRRMSTRRMLSMVDWHLLLLFASLFVVTAALADTALLQDVVAALQSAGVDMAETRVVTVVALAGSNSIGNVPLVALLLAPGLGFPAESLYALALMSTLSGNLLIVGSLANIIAVERAASQGVVVGFGDYARAGIPVTLLSLLAAYGWLAMVPVSVFGGATP
jgi:Na+/H+ antiporter NhaD/arsenite permease-like protein